MFFVSQASVERAAQTLFDPISLSLQAGEGVWLQGANGSGKSSFLSALAGVLPLASGELRWGDQPVSAIPFVYRQHMHYVGHDLLIHPQLSVYDNLQLDLRCASVTPSAALAGMRYWGLPADLHRSASQLSAGQRQRLALLRLQLSQASLWLLDEPLVALDHDSQQKLLALCGQHLDEGGLLIISSHQALGSLASRLSLKCLTRGACS